MGTKTLGQGLIQSVSRLGDGSGLAVTIAKFLTPNGRDIDQKGIDPDIIIELEEATREKLQSDRNLIGTIEDPQFVKAIETLGRSITRW